MGEASALGGMAAATGTLEGQDSFFNQQAGPQQALQLEALQQARVGGSLDSQVLGTSGFDTKAALEQLQVTCSLCGCVHCTEVSRGPALAHRFALYRCTLWLCNLLCPAWHCLLCMLP